MKLYWKDAEKNKKKGEKKDKNRKQSHHEMNYDKDKRNESVNNCHKILNEEKKENSKVNNPSVDNPEGYDMNNQESETLCNINKNNNIINNNNNNNNNNDNEKYNENKAINVTMEEINTDIIWYVKNMTKEEKTIFLNNYIRKMQYLREVQQKKISYYETLNVNVKADTKTIRNSYLMLSKLMGVHTNLSEEFQEYYYLIQKAYKILTDKFEKFYYDILNNYLTNESQIEEQRIILEKEADQIYEKKKKELTQVYLKKVKEETKKNGLIIEKALYGNLVLKDEYINNCLNIEEITEKHLEGPFYDLTFFLQSKVENSSLLFNEETSFAYFCEIPKPLIKIKTNSEAQNENSNNKNTSNNNKKKIYAHALEDTETHLYIKYKFLNVYHELIIVDRVNFSLPHSSHRVFGNHISGPFSPANVIKMKHISNSFFDNIFTFFSKNKVYITLFTTLLLCAQSIKSM